MHESTRRKQVVAILSLGFVAGVAILLWRAEVVTVTVTNRSKRIIERVVVSLDAEGDEEMLATREIGPLHPGQSTTCSLRHPSRDSYLSVACHFDDGTLEEDGDGYVTRGLPFVTFQVTIGGDGDIEIDQRL